MNGQIPISEPLLRAADVARRLNISTAAAYRLLESGQLPAIRWSGARGSIRCRAIDLENFIAGNRQEALDRL